MILSKLSFNVALNLSTVQYVCVDLSLSYTVQNTLSFNEYMSSTAQTMEQ